MHYRKCKFKVSRTITRTNEELMELSNRLNMPLDECKKYNLSYAKQVVEYGYFHQFSMEHEEYDNVIGNYTIALVEDCDGKICIVDASNIEFLPDNTHNAYYEHHMTKFGF